MAAGGRFRIWYRHIDASSGAAAQSSVRITLAAAVGSVPIVTEDAPEPIGDVGTAVFASRMVD
ncbi:hypothetical protein C500_01785 [Natrialba magadii ATCC 43099]|uniref:Uncharacterized protein n=1 Tax=Natrialba magadii (strain ATCC 43099 / DSM 3394 / CCM 3739 / CIP 104546 / IAM 13178 / JCM 8861 / NBRC 102185 / NCIMB 2190 / MS3) TaxID=547559 RepID=L9VAZ9_NATMM|nr:hypothetical protein C500_01785 [Natrialba magadii ATCC 43099]